jgi:hypothetical protein
VTRVDTAGAEAEVGEIRIRLLVVHVCRAYISRNL